MTEPHENLANFMDLLLDAICVVNTQGQIVFISAACKRIFGYTSKEMHGKSVLDLVHPDDRERTASIAHRVIEGEDIHDYENRYIHKDGHTVYIRWSARWSEKDQMRIAVAHDISDRKRAEILQNALYAISEAAHNVSDLPSLFPVIHNIIGELLPAKNCFVALHDKFKDELYFPYFVDELHELPHTSKLDNGSLSTEVIRGGQSILLTSGSTSQTAEQYPHIADANSLDWLGVPLKAGSDAIGALVVQSYSGDVRYSEQDKDLLQFVSDQIASAITRTQQYERLIHAAGHDSLTGLANRSLFKDRLQYVLTSARRNPARFAVLYLDLDKFKEINDRHGHLVGDKVLVEVATRLRACIRESDTVARIGGDEFILLINNIMQSSDAENVAIKIRQTLQTPYLFEGSLLAISPSIGIAHYPDNGDTASDLIHYADKAMYSYKK